MTKDKDLNKAINIFLESYRLYGRSKLWKFGIEGREKLIELIWDLIRLHKKEFANRLFDYGLISLKDLSEREQQILECRYKLLETYKQISRKFGITIGRVRQIELKALDKIKNPIYYKINDEICSDCDEN